MPQTANLSAAFCSIGFAEMWEKTVTSQWQLTFYMEIDKIRIQ